MTLLTVTWNGFVLGGPDSPVGIRALNGWLGLPGGAASGEQATADHGQTVGTVRQGPRDVIVDALIRDYANRDTLLADFEELFAAAPPESRETAPLTVNHRGVVRYANAQLLDYKPVEDVRYLAAGFTPFRLVFHCPDPRIFGARITMTTPLTPPSVGAAIGLAIPFDLPADPIGGTINLYNPGNATSGSDVTVTLAGPQQGTQGVRNETTGGELFFDFELLEGDVLVVSSEEGGELNGEYRQSSWPSQEARRLRAAPGLNVFKAVGRAGDSPDPNNPPTITVAVDPAYL